MGPSPSSSHSHLRQAGKHGCMLAFGQDKDTPCVMCNTQHAVVWHVGSPAEPMCSRPCTYAAVSLRPAPHTWPQGSGAPWGPSLTHSTLATDPLPLWSKSHMCAQAGDCPRAVRKESHTDGAPSSTPASTQLAACAAQRQKASFNGIGCKLAASPGVQGSLWAIRL